VGYKPSPVIDVKKARALFKQLLERTK